MSEREKNEEEEKEEVKNWERETDRVLVTHTTLHFIRASRKLPPRLEARQ